MSSHVARVATFSPVCEMSNLQAPKILYVIIQVDWEVLKYEYYIIMWQIIS